MVTTLKTHITQVDKIFHLADIHIRNFIRHKEYLEVFERTVEEISKHKTDNSIIYVAGDIVHSKSDMSPELVKMVSKFFKLLVDQCPTIVILGNHDTNLNNPNRLDTLKPIIELMNDDRLYFLHENGYYSFAQLGLNLMEVSTLPANYKSGYDFDFPIKIALHHGAVNFATTDLHTVIKNKEVTLDTFEGHDLALLGDIHKRQILQYNRRLKYDPSTGRQVVKPTVAYPSSLIQQGHGEAVEGHGFLIWDLKTLSFQEVNIPNDYGYFTLQVENGKILNWSDKIPKKPRLRVYFTDTSVEDQKIIEAYVRSQVNVVEWTSHKIKTQTSGQSASYSNIGNIRDVEYQNTLLEQFLSTDTSITEEILDQIRYINRVTNSKLPQHSKTGIMRGVQWIPERFEFSNMFSYGENNILDFREVKGVYGIFGRNAIGKSTVFDSLCFCLFDKCSKTYKAKDVINRTKDNFECKFTFTIDTIKYTIHKKATRTRYDNIKVDIDFYYENEKGDIISLNGEQRDATSKVIRDYVGTYEDFILTVLSVQNNGTNFIEKPQRERRELIVNFLDISIFEHLYAIASEDFNASDIKWKMKAFESQDFAKKLAQAIKDRSDSQTELQNLKYTLHQIQDEIEKYHTQKHQCSLSLRTVKDVIPVEKLEGMIKRVESEIERLKAELENLESKSYQDRIDILQSENIEQQVLELEEELTVSEALTVQLNQLKTDLNYQTKTKSQYEKHIYDLQNHKYNPECEFCVSHSTVKVGTESLQRLEECKTSIDKLTAQIEKVSSDLKKFVEVPKALKVLRDKQSELTVLVSEQLKCVLKKYECQTDLDSQIQRLDTLNLELEKSLQLQQDLTHNELVNKQIHELDQLIDQYKKYIADTQEKISHHTGVIYTKDNLILECEQQIREIQELKVLHQAYTAYLLALKTDGIPYKLTNQIIPIIEEEVNNILKGVVDFKLALETDNKNINAYICYGDEIAWPVESGSGMEKFMVSLALRTALILNTSLPKPNFICIDEGFGVLDGDNLSNINILFEKIKDNFDTVFSISHIDSMRDIMDGSIHISKIGGDSFICVE